MILVYLETSGDRVPKTALSAIAAALQMKERHGKGRAVGLIVGNEGVEAAAKEASRYGLDEVCFVKAQDLDPYLAVVHQPVLLKVAEELGAADIVAVSSTRGKDLMPRVAASLNAAQASDVLEILPAGRFKRPMYAGNIIAEVELTTEKRVVTVRPTAFDPAVAAATECSVRQLEIAVAASQGTEFKNFETVKSERPELTEAEIVVSGGRALKSAENFEKIITPLADALGAAIGASRAAVDSGYAPNDWQVGQTGKVVAPKLYIAVGISGAIQHLAGMKDSKVIVAINKDPEAPIFEVADYGLVADLFEAAPALTDKLKAR